MGIWIPTSLIFRCGIQMVPKRLNTKWSSIQMPFEYQITRPFEYWTNAHHLMYWSSLRMINLVHMTKYIDQLINRLIFKIEDHLNTRLMFYWENNNRIWISDLIVIFVLFALFYCFSAIWAVMKLGEKQVLFHIMK